MSLRPFSVILLVFLTACGKSSSPATPTPTVSGLSIAPATDMIKIKASESFTAQATYSDGTSHAVTASWSSDNSSVATIDASGRATAVNSGSATIIADYQGMRATRLLRVVPDYQGRWQGDWTVTACTEDGDWQRIRTCESVYPNGSLWALTLSANQNRDAVTGTTDFGDELPGPVNGTIRTDGHLVLTGTYTIVFENLPVEITISEWDTTTTDNQQMSGRLRLTLRAAGVQGSVGVSGDLRIVSKTSTTPVLTSSGGGVGIGRAIARIMRTTSR